MHFALVGLQQNVGKNRQRGAGADDVLHLLQGFEQFSLVTLNFMVTESLRCKASILFGNRNLSSLPLAGNQALPLERAVDERDRLANVVLLGIRFFTSLQACSTVP
jgi:hypothetical protein